MIKDACKSPFAKSIAARIGAAGLGDFELVSEMPDSSSFGDAEAVFRLGPLTLRFSRDRGQELVDVAFGDMPERFFLVDDIDIALGWKSIDEALSKQEPESLESVLGRLAAHAPELSESFSGPPSRLTRARVERAEHDRGEAFMKRLRGNQ
ncbi:MAG: hypothetical protein HYV17_08795 [Xanthomonadales bacterium]|nr:hypothetical protein [Xanthomonadales bacterium]